MKSELKSTESEELKKAVAHELSKEDNEEEFRRAVEDCDEDSKGPGAD